ncbi:MAG TPA: hypothetical protein VGM93_12035 [Acidimicrobiales bacterium]
MIEVKASFFFLAFLLFLFKPVISIDGSEGFKGQWGINPVPVPPGQHRVEVWCPYIFLRFMGRNGVTVDVPAGSVVRVRWRVPLFVFLKGSIHADSPAGIPSGATAPQSPGAPVAPAPPAPPAGDTPAPPPPPPA